MQARPLFYILTQFLQLTLKHCQINYFLNAILLYVSMTTKFRKYKTNGLVIKSEKKEYERTALKEERSLCCCMG